MKASLFILLLAISLPAAAQTADDIYRQACGPKNVTFSVGEVKGQPPAAPEPGKALVYFIKDTPFFTTRFGLDGVWIGAMKQDSYLFASVAPGEHHICAFPQKSFGAGQDNLVPQFAHFSAEAGKTYYYLVRGGFHGYESYVPGPTWTISPADRDEALFLIASDPQSVATPKP